MTYTADYQSLKSRIERDLRDRGYDDGIDEWVWDEAMDEIVNNVKEWLAHELTAMGAYANG